MGQHLITAQPVMTLERNLLAEFFSRLATMAFERGQWELATNYNRLVNEVSYDNRSKSVPCQWRYSVESAGD